MATTTATGVVHCVGSPTFEPDQAIADTATHEKALEALRANDFETAITTWFRIPEGDDFVYHATSSVKLALVQHAVGLGRANGLHGWYWSDRGEVVRTPSLTNPPLAP